MSPKKTSSRTPQAFSIHFSWHFSYGHLNHTLISLPRLGPPVATSCAGTAPCAAVALQPLGPRRPGCWNRGLKWEGHAMWPPKEEFSWPSKMPFDLFEGTTMYPPGWQNMIWNDLKKDGKSMLKYDEMWCETQHWSRCWLDGKPWHAMTKPWASGSKSAVLPCRRAPWRTSPVRRPLGHAG